MLTCKMFEVTKIPRRHIRPARLNISYSAIRGYWNNGILRWEHRFKIVRFVPNLIILRSRDISSFSPTRFRILLEPSIEPLAFLDLCTIDTSMYLKLTDLLVPVNIYLLFIIFCGQDTRTTIRLFEMDRTEAGLCAALDNALNQPLQASPRSRPPDPKTWGVPKTAPSGV